MYIKLFNKYDLIIGYKNGDLFHLDMSKNL